MVENASDSSPRGCFIEPSMREECSPRSGIAINLVGLMSTLMSSKPLGLLTEHGRSHELRYLRFMSGCPDKESGRHLTWRRRDPSAIPETHSACFDRGEE